MNLAASLMLAVSSHLLQVQGQSRLPAEMYSRNICGMLSIVMAVHYNDTTMGTMASQMTSLTFVYLIVYSGVDQRKHQSSMSQMFPFDDVIIYMNLDMNTHWYNDHWAINTWIPGWNARHVADDILMCFPELEYHDLEKMKFILNSPLYHCAAVSSAVQQVGGMDNCLMACVPCHYFLTMELTEKPDG